MSWNQPQNNPYQSQPTYPGYADPQKVRERIYPAGFALLIVGLVGAVLMFAYGVLSVIMLTVMQPQMRQPNNGAQISAFWIGVAIPHLAYLFNVFANLLVAYAGYSMMKFKNYTLSMIGSIVAVIPLLSACCLLGVPFGIWGIVALTGSGAKDVFES